MPSLEEEKQDKTERSPRASARGSARSDTKEKTGRSINPATDRPYSERTMQDPETFRSAMSTARAHTAIAALAAQRQALESRLSIIEAALENEGKRAFMRPRGTGPGASRSNTKGKSSKK